MRMPVSESFKSRADSAAFYEAWVATLLSRGGLYALHLPFVISDSKDLTEPDLKVFSDPEHYDGVTCDFRCKGVEIKSVSVTFHNVDTYPFDTVLVCSQNSFLRKWPGSSTLKRDFLIVSRKTGSVIWIPSGTQVELGKEVTDKSRNETYKVVTVSKDALRPLQDFIEMVKDAS